MAGLMSPYEKYGAGQWLPAVARALTNELQANASVQRWSKAVSGRLLTEYLEFWLAQRLGMVSEGLAPAASASCAAICEHLVVRRVLIAAACRELAAAGMSRTDIDGLFPELEAVGQEKRHAERAVVNPSLDANARSRKHIASLDDSRTWQTLLRARLPEYVIVHPVETWPALVVLLCKEPIDLVILDLYMPEPDGLECLTRLRADPRFSRLSVVLCTSRPTPQTRERAAALGAVSVLGKSQDPTEFRDRLLEFLDAPSLASGQR